MEEEFKEVMQFRVELVGITPPIWRRIRVPENHTFGGLHGAIQDSMDWEDYHLHEFMVKDPATHRNRRIGNHVESYRMFEGPEDGLTVDVAEVFREPGYTGLYIYDFGDNWKHRVEFEGRMPREAGVRYPVCIDGERACPPEDSGGPIGYNDMVNTLKKPGSEHYKEIIEWLGGHFDPEHFDISEVNFCSPEVHADDLMEMDEEMMECEHQVAYHISSAYFCNEESDRIKEKWFLFELSNAIYGGLAGEIAISRTYNEKELVELAIDLSLHGKEAVTEVMRRRGNKRITNRDFRELAASELMGKYGKKVLKVAVRAINVQLSACLDCPTRCIHDWKGACYMFDMDL